MTERQLVEQLQELTRQFIDGLPAQLGALEAEWLRVWREGWHSPALEHLISQSHSLTGVAGSLGFREIARWAGELQAQLKIPLDDPAQQPARYQRIDGILQSLREAARSDQQADPEQLVAELNVTRTTTENMQEKRADRLIYMVDDDPIQAADLAAQIGYFGYSVSIFTTLKDLEKHIKKARPTVLLMDISFPEGRMAGYEMIESLQAKIPDLPPVIFVSVNDSINFRLQAVRVGGKAYFTKPVDVGGLIDVLDRLVFHDAIAPFRVLIAEDSRVQANYLTVQLRKAGIVTENVSNPMQVVDRMISFNPDLLLLDMYMPDCTGMELAQIIRQMEQFVSVPIVFLSAETDRDKQMAAMGIGGDDFLTKPIEPEHLISAVTTRIERYRKLRALMNHDGLTGLLNHSTTKERLVREIDRARRQNEPLAFAMLDLDHFKQVNDSFGHAAGDRVLKSLAHMLRQRLRGSDTIGRFGGEEFAVILPGTDEQTAARIMAELCAGFAKIRHQAGEKEFSVTFSCGVAAFPEIDNAGALTETADMAMYAAKAAGRSQVMAASQCNGEAFSAARARPAAAFQPSGLSHAILYQNLVRHANSAILRYNRQGEVTYANEYTLRFFGFSEPELIGQPLIGTLVPREKSAEANLKAMIAGIAAHPERYAHMESENRRKDGEKIWMAWSNTPLTDENGSLIEILTIGNNITDRIHAEAELARTISYLSTITHISQSLASRDALNEVVGKVADEVSHLFNAQHVGIALLEEGGRDLKFIGNSEHGWNIEEGVPNLIRLDEEPASRQVVQEAKAAFFANAAHNPLFAGTRQLLRMHQVNGRAIIPLIVSGKVIGTMNIDFETPERTLAQTELELAQTIAGSIAGVIEISRLFNAEQRQRQFFEALVENIPAAVEMIDLQGRIQSWNPAAQALFGYTPAEAIGRNIDELLATEDTRAEAANFTKKSFEDGERIHFFSQRRRKDGSLAEVELIAVPLIVGGQPAGSLAIYHDISDLQRARREAEAANEAKSSFLATMSHEIRTPLNAIVGMTTLLLEADLTDEQRDFTETIRSSSDALLTIINDILDFSKIEAGRMELEEQAFDLRECIESAFDLVSSRATEKGIDLAYLMDPNVPSFVVGDSTRLRQILLNLLSNSLKFTASGEVVLSVSVSSIPPSEDAALRLQFAVRDTGIGIPPERKERLFRSFSQVDASTTRKYGGTGLGLAISKRLSELMGGSMWVESEGVPGKGATFYFTLQTRLSTDPVPVFLNSKQPELSGRRVLIVDDNATNRYILMRQVQSWGMLPQETADPRQALEWIRAGQQFDLALLDMQMPEMDGLTLAAEIQRGSPEQANLPLVMLTSLGLRDLAQEGARFDAYLTKPIKPALLYTTLLGVFGPKEKRRKRVGEKPAMEAGLAPLPPMRILLAEDMVVNQKVALLLLERLGCRADVVGNGLEVLEALRRQPYDVILMDVQMPEMDGLEAARAVRAGGWQGASSHTLEAQPYIIAMTANAMQGDRETCMAAGMDDYVSKPVQVEELAHALNRAAEARRASAEEAGGEALPRTEEKPLPASIDAATFEKFRASLGEDNQEMLVSLIRDYLEEGEGLARDIAATGQNGSLESLRRAAHSLKSSSQMFGLLELAAICKTIEAKARAGDAQSAVESIEKMQAAFATAQADLRAWLEGHGPFA